MKEVPVWFPGARLNYAENLLFRNDDAIAITAGGETGVVIHYTFRQLRHLVRRMAAALRVNGLEPGDRVAGRSLYHFLLFETNFRPFQQL
jgi:acetoacetyl-CoA synthetase